jgi:hypothetical protein
VLLGMMLDKQLRVLACCLLLLLLAPPCPSGNLRTRYRQGKIVGRVDFDGLGCALRNHEWEFLSHNSLAPRGSYCELSEDGY